MADTPGLVYLVGAGPGDPGLLTIRGLECLRKADLIIYDRLVSPSLLHAARADAARICVNELASRHADRWPIINERMIAAARSGSIVVRLKGGDPAIFAHLAEETAALRSAGVAYEIVPGVTAALGAAAYSEIPLTHRDIASAVAFVTGHENPGKSDSLVDWAGFARFPGTLVLYMSMARIDNIVESLLKGGKEASTPAIVIQNSTRGDEVEVRTTLSELSDKVKQAGLDAPCVIIVGPVVDLKPTLSWSQKRPLAGTRVLVPRPIEQGLLLARRLEELGAIPLIAPAIVVAPPADWGPVDRAIEQLTQFEWIVFTSANGVHAFIERLGHTNHDLRALGKSRLATIGPATAAALASYRLRADLVPGEFVSEALAAELLNQVRGGRVLLVRAEQGRDVLRETLAKVAEVKQVAVYRQTENPDLAGILAACWNDRPPDFVLLTSSNIARALLRALTPEQMETIRLGQVRLITISGVTTATVRELGLPVAGEAQPYTTEAMLAKAISLRAE
ncbi:MAG TPA: uroporphyrinogen-III C-methyltransferase [Gemmataceae bacterium]|jgi:uroporphyrinogen III methyltransferase/synthase|nr:uroporphyrinogen-III C-methyltransferase [Gemmataceae bacterium]